MNSPESAATRRILLTGFTPFEGRKHNASWIAASALAERPYAALELRAALIPVCWGAPRRVLAPLVTEWQPHCIIGLGEGEAGVFRLETLAHNTRRERADNDGVFPQKRVIDEHGPQCREASADCTNLSAALAAKGVPVRISTDAGAFLCEELLYTLEAMRATHETLDTVLFVHLPPFGSALEFHGQPRVCDEALLLEFAVILLDCVQTLPQQKAIEPSSREVAVTSPTAPMTSTGAAISSALAPCPCDSSKPFNRCCGPFLKGTATPRTAKQLMRSRYSAFALGGYGDHLYASWHPANVGTVMVEDLNVAEVPWTGLTILDDEQKGDRGRVEFKARYLDENGVEHVHHEHSAFLRVNGKWLYLEGKVREA